MKPTRDQLQHYMLSAERGSANPATAAWARWVLEEAMQRAERADRNQVALPAPQRIAYHTR